MEDGKIAGRIALSMLMNASSVGTIVDHLGFSVLNEHVWVIKHQHDVKSANHVTGADVSGFTARGIPFVRAVEKMIFDSEESANQYIEDFYHEEEGSWYVARTTLFELFYDTRGVPLSPNTGDVAFMDDGVLKYIKGIFLLDNLMRIYLPVSTRAFFEMIDSLQDGVLPVSVNRLAANFVVGLPHAKNVTDVDVDGVVTLFIGSAKPAVVVSDPVSGSETAKSSWVIFADDYSAKTYENVQPESSIGHKPFELVVDELLRSGEKHGLEIRHAFGKSFLTYSQVKKLAEVMYRQSYTVIGDVAVSLVCSPDIVPAERDALIKLFAAEKSQWIEKNVIIQGVVKGVTAQVFVITPKEGTKHLPLKVAALRREIRAISEHFIATLPESILTILINTPIRSMEGEVIPLRVEMPSLPHPMFNSSVTG